MRMTREDIDRIATEYLNDTESTFEMEDVIELAIKALKLEEAIEDIKAEIEDFEEKLFHLPKSEQGYAAASYCLDIINKHIGGNE